VSATPPTPGTPQTPEAAGEPTDPDALIVAVEGYSGPFDVLLALARKQQVDLTRISVLQLVEQYLAFLDAALARRLDLAADYLVTASWLAYLKSRLLLPAPSEPEAEEAQAMAEALTQRLQRLEAIRGAVVELGRRARLGVARLPRGRPEGLKVTRVDGFTTGLAELLGAYAAVVRRGQTHTLSFERPELVAVDVARDGLRAGLAGTRDWRALDDALPAALKTAGLARSGRASGFAAALELARTAEVELRQEAPFAPLWLRPR